MNQKFILLPLLLLSTLAGCVSVRRYNQAVLFAQASERARAETDAKLVSSLREGQGLREQTIAALALRDQLMRDTTQLGQRYRRQKTELDGLTDRYSRLDRDYTTLRTNSSTERSALSADLGRKQTELRDLESKITAAKSQNDQLSTDLQGREQRVRELEKVLADKDRAVGELRTRVNNALLGFKDGDLSVDVRNGKVYVSLSEKLLFKSGSYAVDPKGADALRKLASVLKTQPDISVLVEGHTDDVPLAGSGALKDNWDLSVLRATSIVKLLVSEGAPAVKLTAAGRSQYLPVDPAKTPEARQKNRRTDVILTPKLDELFRVLEGN